MTKEMHLFKACKKVFLFYMEADFFSQVFTSNKATVAIDPIYRNINFLQNQWIKRIKSRGGFPCITSGSDMKGGEK